MTKEKKLEKILFELLEIIKNPIEYSDELVTYKTADILKIIKKGIKILEYTENKKEK